MSILSQLKNSIGVKGAQIFCMEPDLPDGITYDQVVALHVCKHEMLAALWRCYAECPPEVADPVIGPKLKKMFP